MCLIDTKRFRFTFKPIKVYKVVNIDNTSPFKKKLLTCFNFTLNGFASKHDYILYYDKNRKFLFEKGFFHACQTKEKAEALIESLVHERMIKNKWNLRDSGLYKLSQSSDYKIVEGWILPFTRYAIGDNNDICSRILILNL